MNTRPPPPNYRSSYMLIIINSHILKKVTLILILFFQVCRQTIEGNTCKIPFDYEGVRYDDCTSKDNVVPWCYTVSGTWGNCNMSKGNDDYLTV